MSDTNPLIQPTASDSSTTMKSVATEGGEGEVSSPSTEPQETRRESSVGKTGILSQSQEEIEKKRESSEEYAWKEKGEEVPSFRKIDLRTNVEEGEEQFLPWMPGQTRGYLIY